MSDHIFKNFICCAWKADEMYMYKCISHKTWININGAFVSLMPWIQQNAKNCFFQCLPWICSFILTSKPELTEVVPPDSKKSVWGVFQRNCTHVSGEIFIWLSTIRHSELKRIIHISIISFPLCGPLLSDLWAFPAFPGLQQFIPAAAAICISPEIVVRWIQKERMKWGQCKLRLEALRSQCKQGSIKVQCTNWWLSYHEGDCWWCLGYNLSGLRDHQKQPTTTESI